MDQQNKIKMTWGTWLFESRWPEFEEHKEKLKELVYEDAKTLKRDIDSDVAVNHKSNLIEPQLNFFTKYQTDQRLLPLMEYLDYQIRSVYTSLCDAHSNRDWPNDVSVYFRDSWYHITKDRGYHDAHMHGNSSFCGIFYLDIGESNLENKNGINKFFTPYMPSTDQDDHGYSWWPSETISIVPENGKLVLFPGYLLHNATPYEGKTDRLVLAFNCQIKNKGDVGMTINNLFSRLPLAT
jgi:uncharacterized protein (TIGR02466 family)